MRRNQNKQRKNPRRGTTGRGVPSDRMISHPPQLQGIELRHGVTLRFRGVAAASLTAITFANLLDTMLVATTATAGTDLFQTVRVRRVRAWAIGAIGTPTSVSVEFAGITTGVIGDQAIHTDTSVGIQPAHIDARPSARSLASDYQLSSGAVAFIITCPAGTVVDVELSFRSQFYNANQAAAQALVAATAGVQYLRGMDGLATAASNWIPEYTLGQI